MARALEATLPGKPKWCAAWQESMQAIWLQFLQSRFFPKSKCSARSYRFAIQNPSIISGCNSASAAFNAFTSKLPSVLSNCLRDP